MLQLKRCLRSLATLGLLAAPVMITGCAVHTGYRVYDPYYRDYHPWDDHERGYYNQWTVEVHKDPHRDYRRLNRHDQREYWNWRHNHDRDRH